MTVNTTQTCRCGHPVDEHDLSPLSSDPDTPCLASTPDDREVPMVVDGRPEQGLATLTAIDLDGNRETHVGGWIATVDGSAPIVYCSDGHPFFEIEDSDGLVTCGKCLQLTATEAGCPCQQFRPAS